MSHYTPRKRSLGGYIGITPSVCLSVRLSRVNLTLVITFQPLEIRLSYYTCWFLVIRPFCPYQKNLTLWPWPWLLTYFWKNLTLAITFETREIRLSYYRYVFLVARPFCPYQKFWPCDLDLDFWPTFEKLNLGYNFWTKRDEAFIVQVCIPCGKTFMSIPKILTLWSWPWLLTYFRKNLTLTIIFEPKVIGL